MISLEEVFCSLTRKVLRCSLFMEKMVKNWNRLTREVLIPGGIQVMGGSSTKKPGFVKGFGRSC